MSRKKHKGQHQGQKTQTSKVTVEPPKPRQVHFLDDLEDGWGPEMEIQCAGVHGPVWVKGGRLYRKTNGLMSVVTEVEKATPDAELYIDHVDWDTFPPLTHIKYLFRTFLNRYPKEVMVIVGRRWDETGWFYMVPAQTGGVASIAWSDKEGMEWFDQHAMYVGTIHIHPGPEADPSDVDLKWWGQKDASGLHMVVGRTEQWIITGSSAGQVIRLRNGINLGTDEEEVPLYTSLNRPFEELLKDKVVKGGSSGSTAIVVHRGGQTYKYTDEEALLASTLMLDELEVLGSLVFSRSEISGLRVVVLPNGDHVMCTAFQWYRARSALTKIGIELPLGTNLTRFALVTGKDGEV